MPMIIDGAVIVGVPKATAYPKPNRISRNSRAIGAYDVTGFREIVGRQESPVSSCRRYQ